MGGKSEFLGYRLLVVPDFTHTNEQVISINIPSPPEK